MNLLDLLMIGGLFLIRIGIPIAITVAVAIVLRRLDAKWEVELRQQAAARPQPALPKRPAVGIQLPQLQPMMLTASDVFGKPCWDINDCQPAQKATCAAAQQPDMACWSAKFQSMGKMPEQCYNCNIYLATQPFLSPPASGYQQPEIRH